MDHYAGIDVSLECSSVCVVDASGKIIRESKVASEAEALIARFTGGQKPTRLQRHGGNLLFGRFNRNEAHDLAGHHFADRLSVQPPPHCPVSDIGQWYLVPSGCFKGNISIGMVHAWYPLLMTERGESSYAYAHRKRCCRR